MRQWRRDTELVAVRDADALEATGNETTIRSRDASATSRHRISPANGCQDQLRSPVIRILMIR
jgi:hypothetical protein